MGEERVDTVGVKGWERRGLPAVGVKSRRETAQGGKAESLLWLS